MSTDWYVQQFGDREQFALSISFGRDPHPTGDDVLDASWGGLSIWVRGRCLTRSVSSDGGVPEDVRWGLLGIIRWLINVGVQLVNEEPFPDTTSLDNVRDACEWYNATSQPFPSLTETEEDEWFLRRSDWRERHALRRAATDAALPNIMFRRLGDFVEISWDNEAWGAPRLGLSFVEQRGTELLAAARTAAVLRTALLNITQALAERYKVPALTELATAAAAIEVSGDDWRWLIHSQTARVITEDLASLRDKLSEHTKSKRDGLYLPHTPETLVLRQARLTSADDVRSLLEAATIMPSRPMSQSVYALVRPSVADTIRPWVEGYERAQEVRDVLGWGDDPIPDLGKWMRQNNVGLASRPLPSSLDLVAIRTEQGEGSAVVNPRAQSRMRREISEATALGHILFDPVPVVVDGVWEHWPSAARARAFAAMLMMPDEGVRGVLAGRTMIDASDVRRVMDRFNTGPYATAYHLKNRGFIANDDRRLEILRELMAS